MGGSVKKYDTKEDTLKDVNEYIRYYNYRYTECLCCLPPNEYRRAS
ncbi:MAG: IS3 family transposase [Bacillota bacterium]